MSAASCSCGFCAGRSDAALPGCPCRRCRVDLGGEPASLVVDLDVGPDGKCVGCGFAGLWASDVVCPECGGGDHCDGCDGWFPAGSLSPIDDGWTCKNCEVTP